MATESTTTPLDSKPMQVEPVISEDLKKVLDSLQKAADEIKKKD